MPKSAGREAAERVVIRAAAYLSGRTGEEMEREFDRNIGQGRKDFVIDFADTEIINSIGISIIIGIIERIMEEHGTISFSNLSKVNEEIFTMMGLLRYAPLVRRGN